MDFVKTPCGFIPIYFDPKNMKGMTYDEALEAYVYEEVND